MRIQCASPLSLVSILYIIIKWTIAHLDSKNILQLFIICSGFNAMNVTVARTSALNSTYCSRLSSLSKQNKQKNNVISQLTYC